MTSDQVTTETRLRDLEEISDRMAADALLQSLVIKALMATHPNREAAEQWFRTSVATLGLDLSDIGFSGGFPAGETLTMRGHLQLALDGWLKAFRPES